MATARASTKTLSETFDILLLAVTVYRHQAGPDKVHLVAHQYDGVVIAGPVHQVQLEFTLRQGQAGGVRHAEDDEGGLGVQVGGVPVQEDDLSLHVLQHDADTRVVGALARVVGVDVVWVEELVPQSGLAHPGPPHQLDTVR